MSETDLAWLAGFLEGDGSFQITRTTHGHQFRIQISQSVKDVINLDETEKILDSLNIQYRRYTFDNRKHPQEAIYIYRKNETLRLLRLLLPYMRGRKKAQTEMMIEAITNPEADVEQIRKNMSLSKLRGYEDPRGGRKHTKLPPSEWEKIKARLESGATLKEVANDYGVTKQAVWYLKKDHLYPENK